MATVNQCYSSSDISTLGGVINQNQDGSVSVFIPNNQGNLIPVILTKPCCLGLNSSYTFDVFNQKCRWSTSTTNCGLDDVFKIILNPEGNDGTIFNFNSDKDCVLNVEFDFLFKIKCETLNQILIDGANLDYSNIAPELVSQISDLQITIEQKNVECQGISNQIVLLNEQILNSSYSIACDLEDETSTPPTSGKVISFGETGFGLTTDLGSGKLGSNTTGRSSGLITNAGLSTIYCIQEPDGLLAWANILGPINYQNFLNGDLDSYSCSQVQELVLLNTSVINNGGQPLLIICETPLGGKTNLISQLDILLISQINCQTQLDVLIFNLGVLQDNLSTELSNSCIRPIDMFESLNVSMIVEVLSGATYETVYEDVDFFPVIGFGLLYNYLFQNEPSGFYVCGDSNCVPMFLNAEGQEQSNTNICNNVVNSLYNSLYEESNLSGVTNGSAIFPTTISNSAFTSTWLQYQTTIEDESILSLLNDNKIKIGLKINNTCGDICILLDNIKLNKICTTVKERKLFVTSSPGFELDKIRDNKKSWVRNDTLVNRNFEILNANSFNPIRQTNYNVEDDRLVINTKEIDLDISLASAIVTDVWCYLVDNPCLLTGYTYCDPCYQCSYKQFQDFECVEFQDDIPYEFQDGDTNFGGGNLVVFQNSNICQYINTISATTYGSFDTAYTGSISSSYGILGTLFYKSGLTGNLPYTQYSSGISDSTNVIVSENILVNTGTLWGNGRLNNAGIWATAGAANPNLPTNEWIGFSKCIELPTSGVYSIGLAADNRVKLKINGELFYFANDGLISTNFTHWRIFEVTLSGGTNVIEMEGYNDNSNASFAAEIYQADINTLAAMTGTTQLSGVTIFTTRDFRYETNGNIPIEFDLGETSGYSCPTGYFLNTCVLPYTCDQIIYSACPPTVSVSCCGDNQIKFDNLLSQPLSGITVIEDFEYYISSELIDAKNRQTISSYPTLRALYERYMNSSAYCGTQSSGFDYFSMDKFANLVGDYWVDIIEQVIPSTTIWGSVKIYSNNIFDQQKFKYKTHSTLLCENPFLGVLVPSPINWTIGQTQFVDVSITKLQTPFENNVKIVYESPTICNELHVVQMNFGSEFIGTVNVVDSNTYLCETQTSVITECFLTASISLTGFSASAIVIGANGPINYLWSNGDTNPTTTFSSLGVYSLEVTDDSCCSYIVSFEIPTLKACWYSLPDTISWLENGFNVFGVPSYIYTLESMVINGTEQMIGTPPSYTLTSDILNTFSTPTGPSYTNFVEFLNNAFVELGLINYRAQISLYNTENPFDDNEYKGFYIVRPEVDIFNLYIGEIGNVDTIFTESGLGNFPAYRFSNCAGIRLTNGIVNE